MTRREAQDATHEEAPFAITVLGWIFIAMGMVTLAMDVRASWRGRGIDEDPWILLVEALAIVAGVFMLRGDRLGALAGGGVDGVSRGGRVLNAWRGLVSRDHFCGNHVPAVPGGCAGVVSDREKVAGG